MHPDKLYPRPIYNLENNEILPLKELVSADPRLRLMIDLVEKAVDCDAVGSLLDDLGSGENLVFCHPLRNEVITNATYSMHDTFHYVVFDGLDRSDRWALVQVTNLIDAVVTPTQLYIGDTHVDDIPKILQQACICLNKADALGNHRISANASKPVFKGLLLHFERPAHFLLDQLMVYHQYENLLSKNECKVTFGHHSFLVPGDQSLLKVIDYDSSVNGEIYLRLAFVGHFRAEKSIAFYNRIRELGRTYSKLTKSSSSSVAKEKSSIHLWFGFTGQKRCWYQQIQACIQIVLRLSMAFEHVTLVIDGWTGYARSSRLDPPDDLWVANHVEQSLSHIQNLRIINLIGDEYQNKLAIGENIDYFVANFGSGCIVPLLMLGKPGILHTNGKLKILPIEPSSSLSITPLDQITSDNAKPGETADAISYSIDWTWIYRELSRMIQVDRSIALPQLDYASSSSTKDSAQFLELFEVKDHAQVEQLYETSLLLKDYGNIRSAYSISLVVTNSAKSLKIQDEPKYGSLLCQLRNLLCEETLADRTKQS